MNASARARRRVVTSRIPIRFMAEGAEGLGHLKNVSRAGMFVRSSDLPRPGSAITLQFDLPTTGGGTVNLRGEVRWTSEGQGSVDPSPGFGVQILEPPREFAEFFRWAVEQLEKADEPA